MVGKGAQKLARNAEAAAAVTADRAVGGGHGVLRTLTRQKSSTSIGTLQPQFNLNLISIASAAPRIAHVVEEQGVYPV